MNLTPYQAYQQVLEAEQKKLRVKDVSNSRIIKPSGIKRASSANQKPMELEEKTYRISAPKEPKETSEVIRKSKDGNPVDHKAKKFIRAKDINAKFQPKVASPFYRESKGRCTPKSGIFSSDENSVASAISNEVPTNKPVQSKLLDIFDYYTLGIVDAHPNNGRNIDIGMVDALTLHCWTGNLPVVKLILKNGYDAPSSYPGLNPITAAVEGRNLEVLKLVLAVPKLQEFVNKKDGNGNYPLEVAAKVRGTDPYEFAKVLVEKGARDDVRTDRAYSGAMLTLLGGGWTPNLFGELLPVTDLEKKSRDGLTLRALAEKVGNREAVIMIDNFIKFKEESINQSVTHSQLISRA